MYFNWHIFKRINVEYFSRRNFLAVLRFLDTNGQKSKANVNTEKSAGWKKLNPLKAREEESQIKATLQIRLYVLVAPLVLILRNIKERNWVIATNSYFLITISLKPNVMDLKYFKLWIMLNQVVNVTLSNVYAIILQRYRN